MKIKANKMETKSWKDIKDSVYGERGTERRDGLDRDFESFKIGLLLRNAREEKNLTQEQLGELVDKKRTYISRVENNGSNLTLKTLFDIVEKGLGGGAPDSPATYAAMGNLYFDSLDSFQNSFGPNAEKIMGDLPNFTNIEPVIQISEVMI